MVVLGGGPAGHAAALAAARRGATVALVEPDKPGGQCVHYACIPSASMLSAVGAWLGVQELGATGVTEVGELDFGRAVARKDALVARMASGVAASLKAAKVEIVAGAGSFLDAGTVAVTLKDGGVRELSADAFVVCTGTSWEEPSLAGANVVTPDVVQSMTSAPASAVVLGGGAADTAFAVEQAFLLASAGCTTTLALPGDRLVPALDASLDDLARGVLTTMGVTILASALPVDTGLAASVDMVVAVDVRRPSFASVKLEAAGVTTTDVIPVDRSCRTDVAHVYAAGDVCGGAMVTAAAAHMGEVAGANAAGGSALTALHRLPHVLHTLPEIAWVGRTEARARDEGYDVATAVVDLSWTARAITAGGQEGALVLVAEKELGELLGVHVVGPGAAELVAVAAQAMAAELTVDDVAATLHWHPSAAESLSAAARSLVT